LPLLYRGEAVGALSLFRTSPGTPPEDELVVAQALADVAATAFMRRRDQESQAKLVNQLQAALSSRIVIEQAKGIIAGRLGIDVAAAFTLLRQYARRHNRLLSEVAAQVVAGTIGLGRLPK